MGFRVLQYVLVVYEFSAKGFWPSAGVPYFGKNSGGRKYFVRHPWDRISTYWTFGPRRSNIFAVNYEGAMVSNLAAMGGTANYFPETRARYNFILSLLGLRKSALFRRKFVVGYKKNLRRNWQDREIFLETPTG